MEMAETDFDRFRAMVWTDATLQEALWPIHEPQAFVAEVIRLGTQRGLAIVEGHIWEAYSSGSSAWQAIWIP